MFLDKVVFNKTKVPVLNAVLDVTQLRQRVIANNIALHSAGFELVISRSVGAEIFRDAC